MNKFLLFLKTSNRYKHLIGGFIVGLLALSPYAAIYAAAVAASSAHSPKKGLVQSHIFSTMVKGEEQCIIIHEWQWGDYTLHSISDSPEKIKEFIKKE